MRTVIVETSDFHLAGKLVILSLGFKSEAEAADFLRTTAENKRMTFEFGAANVIVNGDLQNAGRE